MAERPSIKACRSLGQTAIEATVVQMDADELLLWEIDENLCRAELTELEREEHLAKRKAIYERRYPQARHVSERGGPGRGNKTDENSAPVSFTEDTGAKLGLSQRAVQHSIRRVVGFPSQAGQRVGRFAISCAGRDTRCRTLTVCLDWYFPHGCARAQEATR